MKTIRDGKVTTLAGLALLEGCDHHELMRWAKMLDLSLASAGQELEAEGRQTRWWKVIAHGTAAVSQLGRPTGLLEAGDSIMNGSPSSVTVVLLTLDRRNFLELPRRHPLVAGRVISRLVDRRAPYEAGLAVA
jgi:hypothetical protein